uniref:Uncharacterized protein n=1 Tax=Suricata suricatta TaxID=37032 RepID=A0A673TGQ0_SURSU
MEAEVNMMELMFQKKNRVMLLKESLAIKSQCQTSHACFKRFIVKQQVTKICVCAAVLKNRTIIQELQKQTDLELSPRTKEKTVAKQL